MRSPRFSFRAGAITLVLLTGLAAGASWADPTAPVVVDDPPVGMGDAFVPGFRTIADLRQVYVEEEYLVSGAADLFSYAHNPPLGPTDIMPIQQNVPYKTRMIVRRPEKAGHFNGTVVIEWWNTTAGFDTAPAWDTSAEYFARNGTIYVGVTNSNQGLAFLVGGCSLLGVLPPTCGTRYATLSLPDDGLAYEMMSQIANLLKNGADQNPLPDDFDVVRIYHTGQSQQGGSMVTYASGFHSDVNDGYFVQQAAAARSINGGPACGSAGSFPFPFCRPVLQGDDRLVRTDLPVPVYHAITETDIEILFGIVARQDDTPTFRYYEVAGGSHLTIHKGVEIIPAGVFGPDPIFLEDLCLNPLNTTADGPIFFSYILNAMWDAMEQQVRHGRIPPAGLRMDTDPITGAVQRDVFGNGTGGVRLPSMDVPTATYTPGNVADPTLPGFLQGIGNLACFLASSVTPFDQATLDELYPTHGSYVNQVVRAANGLNRQDLLLPKDSQKVIAAALMSPIFCGLGFELVLILPPLMWLRARRRH
ncbi:MAG: hypothetical protein JRG80_17985 [Deltaproteobacteria bacterium]|nr:hypothetical protein [Deltaproteobacteria bacterium]MBW2401124.1 hypothetical protein [Deltaproteobacteria bacterium]